MQKLTRPRLDAFLASHATNAPILDIGSSFAPYRRYFPNAITLDIDPKRNPDIVGDVHQLNLSDDSQDNVLCTEVLEHCHDPRMAISEMYRVLKPGGSLILTTRFLFPVHGRAHLDFFRFTENALRSLLKDFYIVEFKDEADAHGTIAVLLQRLIFQSDAPKLIKLFYYILAHFLQFIPVYPQYGNIEKTDGVSSIMSSGYYVYARKV